MQTPLELALSEDNSRYVISDCELLQGKCMASIGFTILGSNNLKHPFEFFIEHPSEKVQQRGQRALWIIGDAIGLTEIHDTSQFIDRAIDRATLRKLEVELNQRIATPHQAPEVRRKPAITSSQNTGKYVYVISCTDSAVPTCKIGIANSAEGRLRGLSTASPHALRLEVATYADNAREVEAAAHAHFADHRRNGEWFELPAREAASFILQSVYGGA